MPSQTWLSHKDMTKYKKLCLPNSNSMMALCLLRRTWHYTSPQEERLSSWENNRARKWSLILMPRTLFWQKTCSLFVFVILRMFLFWLSVVFSILKRFMISMFNHPRTVRRMRHLNLMRQNLVIAKNLLWKPLKNLKRSQGTLEKMIQLTRRDFLLECNIFLASHVSFFVLRNETKWRMSEWHPSGGSYVCAKTCHKIVHNLWVTSTTKYGNMSVYGLKFPIHQLFCYESVSTDVQLVFWHFIGVP